jgi:hypothetical protein
MKRFLGVLAISGLIAACLPGAYAAPGPHGIASDNVEHVTFIPFEVGTATGANFFKNGKDRYMVITGWKSFSIYNINDPAAPVQESQRPFGFKMENEDVATNGKIMIFSEQNFGTGGSTQPNGVHVWDIEDVSNPVEIANLEGAGEHTMSCLLDCKWLYGSDGGIIDLRDPAKPVKAEEMWGNAVTPPNNNGHDVTEVSPGIVLTSTNPLMLLDARKDPTHPKLIAQSTQQEGFVHSNLWPRGGKDKFMMSTGETWTPVLDARCSDAKAGLTTWDTTGWKKTHTFQEVDTFRMKNGTYTDGNPAINAPFGCSSHWFTYHPDFKDGGLIAGGFYNHGTRFLNIDSKGKISEVGFFLPTGGGTSGAYWVTDRIVYAVDYQRGFDVLKWNGKI